MSEEKARIAVQSPWQRRAYEKHRAKVKTAKSMIDVKPPKIRPHVLFNAKRNQLERERQTEIIRNNLILLRKLYDIMFKPGKNRLLQQKSECIRTR